MYSKTVILYDSSGKFINVYGESAILLSNLMEYKLINGSRVGFPKTSIGKVKSKLEKEKVSYVILDKHNKELFFFNLKNISKFDDLLKNARKNLGEIQEIDRIIKLLEKADSEKLKIIKREIEKCLI